MSKGKKYLIFSSLLIVIICIITVFIHTKQKLNSQEFEFTDVLRGELIAVVSATGTINPVNTITVGTQVSGIIEKIHVDFNDKVEQGQILAELDQSLSKVMVANTR